MSDHSVSQVFEEMLSTIQGIGTDTDERERQEGYAPESRRMAVRQPYVLSVDGYPVMYDIKAGRYRMGGTHRRDQCGYCKHRLTIHLRETSVMTTSIWCELCGHSCIIWQHVPFDYPVETLISYERQGQ